MKIIHLIAIGLSVAAIASGIFISQTYNHAAKAGATENQKEQNLGSNTQQHQNTGQEAAGGDNGNDFGD